MPGGTELRAILMYDANDDAKAGFRRIEVLTGPGRRRRWQLCPQQLFGWRRQALREGGDHRGTEAADDRHAAFVPLVMEAQSPPPSASVSEATPSMVEVRLADAVVRVVAGTDAAWLTAVLRAVRASAARR
jgi:transposase